MTIKVQHIAVTKPDGSLAITQIIVEAPMRCFGVDAAAENGFVLEERDEGSVWVGGITDEGVEAELTRAGMAGCSWRRIDADEIPQERTFRAAWSDDGRVFVDMAKARDIHRDRLRKLRVPKLAALDVEYQKADEIGGKELKALVAAKKQALRDVTADPAIDAAKTPEELAAVMPEALQ